MLSSLASGVKSAIFGSGRPDITTVDPSRCAFQYMSDLHLELCAQYLTFEFQPTAPYLILAGDIGYIESPLLCSFLTAQAKRYEKVFFVLGNHEFFGVSYTDGLGRAYEVVKTAGSNVFLLQQGRHVISLPSPTSANPRQKRHIHILGCTLWSQIPPTSARSVESRVSDFKKISDWTVEAHNKRHKSDRKWLQEELAFIAPTLKPDDKILVITHHAPTVEGTSAPDKAGSPVSCAFATELMRSGTVNLKGVVGWVHGHTHYSNTIGIGKTTVLSNQRGYAFPENNDGFGRKSKTDATHDFNPDKTLWL